jgi:hypothetical protein
MLIVISIILDRANMTYSELSSPVKQKDAQIIDSIEIYSRLDLQRHMQTEMDGRHLVDHHIVHIFLRYEQLSKHVQELPQTCSGHDSALTIIFLAADTRCSASCLR